MQTSENIEAWTSSALTSEHSKYLSFRVGADSEHRPVAENAQCGETWTAKPGLVRYSIDFSACDSGHPQLRRYTEAAEGFETQPTVVEPTLHSIYFGPSTTTRSPLSFRMI